MGSSLQTRTSGVFGFFQFSSQNRYANKQLDIAIGTTKLAYRPFIMVHADASSHGNPIGIILSNDGNGPAILYQIDIYYKGELIDITELDLKIDPFDRFWKQDSVYSRYKIYKYLALKSGERWPMLVVTPTALDDSRFGLERVLKKMSIVVLYTSLTDDTAINTYNIDLLSDDNIAKYPPKLIKASKEGLIPTIPL